MENWIGVGVWIVLGAFIGLMTRTVTKRPEERAGHAWLLAIFGSFGAVIGGMLGVGIFEFDDPVALSAGGMIGAVALSALLAWTYRWGIRGWM